MVSDSLLMQECSRHHHHHHCRFFFFFFICFQNFRPFHFILSSHLTIRCCHRSSIWPENDVNGVPYLLSTFGVVSDNSVCWCLSFKQPLSIKIVLSTLLVNLSLCCSKISLISHLISVIYRMEPNLQHWCTVIK